MFTHWRGGIDIVLGTDDMILGTEMPATGLPREALQLVPFNNLTSGRQSLQLTEHPINNLPPRRGSHTVELMYKLFK